MDKLTSAAGALGLLLGASSLAFAGSHHTNAGITKAQAEREMRTDGYTQVKDLKKEKDGWTARALESGHPVTLLADNHGNVEKLKM